MQNSQLPESLGNRLKQLSQVRSQISAAQLQIINLADIAAAFGDRWDQVRTRVFNTALHFLKKRLGEFDTLIPCSDGYIIIFGDDEGEAAELAGLRLAEALNKFFVGELGNCEVGCKHLSLGLEEIETFVSKLAVPPDAKPVQGTQPSREDEETRWDYTIRFRPVSDVRRNFIVTYFAEPIGAMGKPFRPDEITGPAAATRRAFIELDLATIQAGLKALRKIVGGGGSIIVGLTIHIESLADQTKRHAVLDAIGQIDPELRRYVVIRLTNVPPGFPRFHLDEHIRLLHQKQIRLGLDLSAADPNTDVLKHPCLWSFGYHFDQPTAALFRDYHNPIAVQLRARAKRLHEAGKRLAVIADGAPNIAQIVSDLEADYVSSLDIWPLCLEPESLHPA